jgi:hypothetical protein
MAWIWQSRPSRFLIFGTDPRGTRIIIPSDQIYLVTLQPEPKAEAGLDALAEIAGMAEPLGPTDLARNFDAYTGRVITDESAESGTTPLK